MRTIVNADDLGMSRPVNDAIFELMGRGHVTSATVLANAEALDDAAARHRGLPRCSFGVHLNASQWQPLTRNPALSPILDASGNFDGDKIRHIQVDSPLKSALFDEWSKQIERVASAGFDISHFDSHHHLHTVPAVFPVLKQLQRKFNIRRIRCSMNLYAQERPASKKLLAAKWLWNTALRRYLKTTTTHGFTSLAIFHQIAAQGGRLPFKTMELMVHPGGIGFEDETSLLSTQWWRSLSQPIDLISYRDL